MMTFSTPYSPGTVVRVRIRFTAGSGTKRRPVVILTDEQYHQSRADAIVVALSCKVEQPYYGDCPLSDWKSAGLPLPTKAKGVVQTIDRSTIEGTYGKLSEADFDHVKQGLRMILGLDV